MSDLLYDIYNTDICSLQWDVLSRRWKQRKNVQNIGLLIADEVQLVGGEIAPTYEVVISRTRYVSAQTEVKTRIVARGVSLAIARDLGEWISELSLMLYSTLHQVLDRLIWTYIYKVLQFLTSPHS